MTNEIDYIKLIASIAGSIALGAWGAYKVWFKASTNDFVTKAEMKALELEMREDISALKGSITEVKTALAKMEGDLKTHIEVTKQHNVFVQKQLDRLEESNKDLKHEFNKNFEHLIGNIKQWNESKEYHKLTARIAEKIGVTLE